MNSLSLLRSPLTFTLAVFSCALLSASAADKGTAVLEEDFSAAGLPAGFAAVKGEWKVVDGTLVGAELKADAHAAVLNFGAKNTDSVVSLRFRLDGAAGVNLSLNHAGGHLFRVILDPAKGLSINKDLDKKDPTSKAIVLGAQEGTISSGEWHTLTVAIAGENVTATLDDGKPLAVSHAGLKTEKTGYRLVLKGETVSVDDIRVTTGE